jgi:hypothetical protein
MADIDTQRVADIAQRFLESNDTTAIANWKPTPFDALQVALHNTIHREYPELDPDVVFRIGMAIQATPGSPRQITVQILRAVGQVNVTM